MEKASNTSKVQFIKKMSKVDLMVASQNIGLSLSQSERLWENLIGKKPSQNRFSPINVIYYFGALIVCIALIWFMGNNYSLYGVRSLLFISLIYALFFGGAGIYFWKIKRQELLGGLGLFLSLSLVPLITYAFQDLMGWWPGKNPGDYIDYYSWIKGGWFLMSLTTLALTSLTLYYIRFPLLTVIFYSVLLFLGMDVIPLFLKIEKSDPNYYSKITLFEESFLILIGLVIIAIAFIADRKKEGNFAFWGYFFGVASLSMGLRLIDYDNEIGHFIYCLINVCMIIIAPMLKRKIFLIFGLIGFISYLTQLIYRHFTTSISFPLILSAIGLSVIICGILFQRYHRILKMRQSGS